MSLSAKEASELVGMTKPGIIKSINNGKISAKKNEKGEWQIDPAELFRVYPSINPVDSKQNDEVDNSIQSDTNKVDTSLQLEKGLLESENSFLKEKIEMMEKQLDEMRNDKVYLKEQLKTSLTLIEDMRQKSPQKPVEKRKGFFRRLMG